MRPPQRSRSRSTSPNSGPRGRGVPTLREPCVVTVPNGRYVENSYLVADPVAERCVVIDPGEDPDPILAALRHRGWVCDGIWLTHGHMDHVLGVPALREATG